MCKERRAAGGGGLAKVGGNVGFGAGVEEVRFDTMERDTGKGKGSV